MNFYMDRLLLFWILNRYHKDHRIDPFPCCIGWKLIQNVKLFLIPQICPWMYQFSQICNTSTWQYPQKLYWVCYQFLTPYHLKNLKNFEPFHDLLISNPAGKSKTKKNVIEWAAQSYQRLNTCLVQLILKKYSLILLARRNKQFQGYKVCLVMKQEGRAGEVVTREFEFSH